MNGGSSDDEVWDAVRAAITTSSVVQESREDVLGIAAAELALMHLVDRGARCSRVTVHVIGEIIHGAVRIWSDDLVVLDEGADSWVIRLGAIDAVTGLPRALHTEHAAHMSSRTILDEWTGDEVEVWTRGGRFRGHLVVAADHLEISGTTVIPWTAVIAVHRRS